MKYTAWLLLLLFSLPSAAQKQDTLTSFVAIWGTFIRDFTVDVRTCKTTLSTLKTVKWISVDACVRVEDDYPRYEAMVSEYRERAANHSVSVNSAIRTFDHWVSDSEREIAGLKEVSEERGEQ